MPTHPELPQDLVKVVKDGCLEIRIGPIAQTCLVQLAGELDMANVGAVERELRLVERAEPRTVVLDLSQLEYIDSSGIGLLLDAHSRSQANGHAFRLIRGPQPVHRILELCGLADQLLFLAETERVR